MTAKQIESKLKELYPGIYCSVPTHCIGLPGEDNWTEYSIETQEIPNKHNIIGRGRSIKKAWLAAWEYVNGPDIEKDKKEQEKRKKLEDGKYDERKKKIEALPNDTMFYVQSYGYVGNCLNLWAENERGYTTNIAKAKVFTKQEAIEQLSFRRDQDVFWEQGEIELKSVRMVDMQDVDQKYKH